MIFPFQMDEKRNILTNPNLRIVWHIIFWIVAVVFFTVFFGHQQKEYRYTFYFVALLLPITMLTTYTFFYYLIPRFLITKKYFGFSLRAFMAVLVSFYLGTMAIFLMLFLFMYGEGPQLDASTLDFYFLAVGIYFVILMAVVIKLFKLWYEKQKKEGKLETEKLQAELNMLKSQIHPHFLFNTLNNIYSLSLQKSDSAPEMLVKLSEILQYILYECDGPFVPLEKEITLLKNYTDLEKIRYSKRLEMTWKIPSESPDIPVAPMILLPFVENAFKHGLSRKREKAGIVMELLVYDEIIEFYVKNDKPALRGQAGDSGKHGLGLVNVKQRLDLIYPGRHKLDVNETDTYYAVRLVIDTKPIKNTGKK